MHRVIDESRSRNKTLQEKVKRRERGPDKILLDYPTLESKTLKKIVRFKSLKGSWVWHWHLIYIFIRFDHTFLTVKRLRPFNGTPILNLGASGLADQFNLLSLLNPTSKEFSCFQLLV